MKRIDFNCQGCPFLSKHLPCHNFALPSSITNSARLHNTEKKEMLHHKQSTFDVLICSSSGAWWDGIMSVDPDAFTLTTATPAAASSSSSLTSVITIPMSSVMFFAKLDPDNLLGQPSLMLEFESDESSGVRVVGDVSCIVEPGRIRVAPRGGAASVDSMWSVCCAMSTTVDMMSMERAFDNETEEGFTKHKRQRD
jgi:hypothetical protein